MPVDEHRSAVLDRVLRKPDAVVRAAYRCYQQRDARSRYAMSVHVEMARFYHERPMSAAWSERE